MLEQLGYGWQLFRQSYSLSFKDRSLILLPLMDGALVVFLIILFIVIMFESLSATTIRALGGAGAMAMIVVALLGFYILGIVASYFFRVAQIVCATQVLEGKPSSVSFGLSAAWAKRRQLMTWMLFAPFASSLLYAASSSSDPRVQMMRSIKMAGGSAVGLGNTFVIPIMLYEDLEPKDAVWRNIDVLSRTWNLALAGFIGMNIVFALSFCLGFCLFFVGFLAYAMTGVDMVFVAFLVAMLIEWAITFNQYSATRNILVAALYRFARTGKLSMGYEKVFSRRA